MNAQTMDHKPDSQPGSKPSQRDPRRAKNIRTGLLLAVVAFGFFLLVIFKHQALGA